MEKQSIVRQNPSIKRETIKKISLLSFDLDGTLLTSNLEVTKRTIASINRAVERGVKFTISTGRIPLMMELYAWLINLSGPYISSNGALIQTRDKEVLFQKILSEAAVASVSAFCRASRMHFALLCKDKAYFTKGHPRAAYFDKYADACRRHGYPVPKLDFMDWDMSGYDGEEVCKVLAASDDQDAIAEFKKLVDKNRMLNFALSGAGLIDVTAEGTDKGEGIVKIADYYGVPIDEVCAFGDYDNDIEIFERAGVSVAMGNALQRLKDIADFHTADSDHDGVSEALDILEAYY